LQIKLVSVLNSVLLFIKCRCYFNPSASPVVLNLLLIGICLFAYCFLFYFICKITLNNSNFQIFMFFFQQSCISLLLLIDVAKIQHFRFLPMRFVRFAWIREIKYRKYHEIILKISPKDKKITPIDSKISPKNKKISPIKKIWKPCWGDEVKGEGYILNLYIIFFFRAFSIFDPRVFF
jgi:hypothetical protein